MTILASVVSEPSPQNISAQPLYVDDVGGPERISFGTYFNAFPAGYWSRWTSVKEITLVVRTRGIGHVEVFASDHTSRSHVVDDHEVTGESTVETVFSLAGRKKGGWFWFDLVGEVELLGAEWTTEAAPRVEGKASIGITTFNKQDFCVATLEALGGAPGAMSVIDTVYLVDQGSAKVSDHPGFDAAVEHLGDQLQVIEQPNLGGSGGFSRSMLETIDAGASDFTLLLDDDVRLEPEAIRKLVQFGRYTTRPTIVGGHMLDMMDSTIIHAWAEQIDPKAFLWNPGHGVHIRHDFAARNLRATTWAHRTEKARYAGWWMCLIPAETIRSIGLALPAFIKWDDAEYSVRAGLQGTPTVSLPGSALWHVSWLDKDDSRDWQAYFHARNRILAALLHSPHSGGGTIVEHLRRIDVKHLVSLEYYAAHVRELAYRDILRGPAHLHEQIGSIMPELRAARAGFAESTVYASPQDLPVARLGRKIYDIDVDLPPSAKLLPVWTAKQIARHWTIPTPAADAAPDVEFVRRDATWWRMPLYDSVLVTDPQGLTGQIFRRDREFFRSQLKKNTAALKELAQNWDDLAEQYRAALGEMTAPQSWRATLGMVGR